MSPLSTIAKQQKEETDLKKMETLEKLNSLKKENRRKKNSGNKRANSNRRENEVEEREDEDYDDGPGFEFDSWGYVPGMIFIFLGLFQYIYDTSKGNVNDTFLIAGSQVFCGFGLFLLFIGFLFRIRRHL